MKIIIAEAVLSVVVAHVEDGHVVGTTPIQVKLGRLTQENLTDALGKILAERDKMEQAASAEEGLAAAAIPPGPIKRDKAPAPNGHPRRS